MMCEHELEEVISGQLRCMHCKKYESQILRECLAAANARVDELEKDNARQKRLAIISRLCKNVQACRAEKAEAQLDKMRNCGNCDNWRDCWGEPEEVPGLESCDDHKCGGSTYTQDALIHRMKRMEDALREIAESKLQTIDWAMKRWIDCRVQDLAKAALEEKPTHSAESSAPFDEYCPNPDKEG